MLKQAKILGYVKVLQVPVICTFIAESPVLLNRGRFRLKGGMTAWKTFTLRRFYLNFFMGF